MRLLTLLLLVSVVVVLALDLCAACLSLAL